jgi:hypothetical protein
LVLLSLAVCGLLATPLRAQTSGDGEGPIIITQPKRPSYLTLDPIHGSVSLMAMYEKENLNNQGDRTQYTNMLFTQELSLSTAGNIVSPNIVHWNASGSVTFEEESGRALTGPLSNQSSVGVFDAYDISADMFGSSLFPASVYARRNEFYINRAFASMLQNITTEYGGTVRYNSPTLPSTLNLSHTTTTQSDLSGNQQFSMDQNQLSFDTSYQPTDRQQLSLSFGYTETSQVNANPLNNSIENLNGSVTHNWMLDREGRYVLNSNFNYSQQSGQYPLTYMRVSERLHLRHTDTFETNYTYDFNSQEDKYSTLISNVVTAGFIHRLYQSLVTTGGVSASVKNTTFLPLPGETQGSSSDSQNFAANVGTSYTKKIGPGRFGANLSLGYSQDNNSAVVQPLQILGEPHSFSATDTITLTRRGIDPSPARFQIFDTNHRELHDFTVLQRGNDIEISRNVGGDLTGVNDVLVNYQVDPLPDYTSRSTTLGTGINYAFDEGPLTGLTLYARYFQVNQEISPASALIRPDDIRDTVFGAEYHVWKLTLRAESQFHDSTLAPFDALRFTAIYNERLSERTLLSLSATQNFLSYPTDNSRTSYSSFDANLEYEIMRNLRTLLTIRWRYDDDSRLGKITGLEEQAQLRWTIRQTDLYFMLRNTNLDGNSANSSNLIFQMGVTRNF